jgi:hypothetical protein
MIRKISIIFTGLLLFTGILSSCVKKTDSIHSDKFRNIIENTLFTLDSNLLSLQIKDTGNIDFGAIQCPNCNVLHTRAAEAVFPFVRQYQLTNDPKYLHAAINLGNWLICQQEKDGSWLETPEDWTGTTTDQLLMMAEAYLILKEKLSIQEKNEWELSIREAADFLTQNMDPGFASINYCATTTASLAVTHQIIPDKRYLEKASALAQVVVAKMDDDGFITGEGGRVFGIKYGVDLGYNLDMSLWGLGLYAKITKDEYVNQKVKAALINHINFIYPDGSIDGSWGIRSNKWTTFGSATSDGCQVLFALFDDTDPVYRRASLKNLEYLQKNILEGWVGYGPQYWEIFDKPPCVYPTFTRAKNLAMASLLLPDELREICLLPTEKPGFIKYFPTINLVLARTQNFMCTITAYRYKDPKGKKSKYMHRPTGGAMSYLWLEGHGILQASSQTSYNRWEPMHFPPAEGILPLTSRIEYTDSTGYFTNLYDYEGNIRVTKNKIPFIITTSGELRNVNLKQGGIAYSLRHEISNSYIKRSVKIRFHDHKASVKIIEPFIHFDGMKFTKEETNSVIITGNNLHLRITLLSENATLTLGENKSDYWSPYPSLKATPVTLKIENDPFEYEKLIEYKIEQID